jgi:Fe-S cluster assembly protein SufD
MSGFTPATAAGLDGPEWLAARRAAAAVLFDASTLPSTEEEVWRYSRIADLDLDDYRPALAADAPAGIHPDVQAVIDAVGPAAAVVVVGNGSVVHAEVSPRWVRRGVSAGRLVDDAEGPGLLVESLAAEPPDVFSVMNDAFHLDPVVVRVPAGVAVDEPIVVVHGFDVDGLATFPRLIVDLGEDAQASVLDHYGSADVRGFVAPVVELRVARAARLGYLGVQEHGLDVWQVASQIGRVDADATLRSAVAAFGGDYARVRTDCHLVGRGATGDLMAAYFGEADQTLDFRTFQEHVAPDTTSTLLFKGAVGGRSRSVYTGLIRVGKEARGTNAFQTNRNIKLSDGAWAESVPNLEIENNDVRCSHASAVGPVDEEQRFYLESRGVPPEVADRLIVTGFFDEVLQQLPIAALAPVLRRHIAAKFARRDR